MRILTGLFVSIMTIGAGLILNGAGSEVAPELRYMSFNIWGDYFKNPVSERRQGVAETILKQDADVVGLQEVTKGWWSSGLFEELVGRYAVVTGDVEVALKRAGADFLHGKSGWGNYEPLLIRRDKFSLLDSGIEYLHLALDETKGVTWAVLEDKLNARRYIVFSTHFWWQSNGKESDVIRELNARTIIGVMRELKSKWGDVPVIGGGDLNSVRGTLAMNAFAVSGYCDAAETADVRSSIPSEHLDPKRGSDGRYHGVAGDPTNQNNYMLDHVMYFGKIRAVRHEVVVDQVALDVSDHSPVVVDFISVK